MYTPRSQQKTLAAAAVYLEMRHFQVIEQQYKRSKSHIDIVCSKDDIVYFVEVVHQHGQVTDLLTSEKLRALHQAAESWIDEYKWHDHYRLAAIELSGNDYSVLSFTDNVSV